MLVFFTIGIFLFGYFIYNFGADSVFLIQENFNMKYMAIFIGLTLLGFAPLVWRWQVILKTYNIKAGFWNLFRNTVAGAAVSYTTPASRMGGEPVRIYMLKKELDVDYKTGSATVLIDRYMELLGTAGFGAVALIVLLLSPNMPALFKIGFGLVMLISTPIILFLLYRLVNNRGVFVTAYDFLRLYKIKRWSGFRENLKNVDELMSNFFANHKKEFYLSLLFYAMSGTLWLIEFKYLLLSFGIESTLTEIILVSTVIGLVNFIPVPGQLGFLEAGQTGLFQAMKGDSNIGFALALLLRARHLVMVSLGYLFISTFSMKEYLKKD